MRVQIVFAYFLVAVLAIWSLATWNLEFVFYAITTLFIVWILHLIDRKFKIPSLVLWGFNVWIILHILGGLVVVWNGVLYSQMILPIIGEPYNVLKYDQVVHFYCYFIVTLMLWSVLSKVISWSKNFYILAFITVFAWVWIGGMNEIIEFLATVFIEDVNVGWYENTVIDIISNTLWALTAVLFFKKIK